MRPRTITLLLVVSMLALPLAAYGYQTVVLDEPVLVAAEDETVEAPVPTRQRLQVHDPENPIDDPLMTRQRIHASAAGEGPENFDDATCQRLQDRDQLGATAGATARVQQQQRLQIHDPDNPIDDPLMTQQRIHGQDGQARGGSGHGRLGGDTTIGTGTCRADCPND